MFNLWPKKKSVDEMLKNVNTTCLGLTWIPEDSAKKDAVIKNLREQQEFLYKENEDLKKILENIEEDGTYEHNNAIKLREENVKLKLEIEKWEKDWDHQNENIKSLIAQKDELMKEVLGLRHLKEENVQLMERINKLIEDGTRVCVENASMKESNVQLMERVNEIDSDINKEYQAEIFTLRNDIAVLKARNAELLKNNNRLTVDYNGVLHNGGLKYMEAKYQILEHNYQGCTKYRDEYKHQLNAANKEIEKLKNDIIDYVIEKEEEQKHPMYPIHWGSLDPDILKQAKEQSIEEVVDALKGMKTQGFEDYDLRDFVESEIKNEDPLEGKQIKKDKEFSSEVLLNRVTEYANSLPKSFPNEFQQEITAENLEEKFDKGEDVLDYYKKPWQCPCNKCKETKSEKSWEQAASDLALRVVKLEKQIEELKISGNLTNQ
jgi:hypothetical protein